MLAGLAVMWFLSLTGAFLVGFTFNKLIIRVTKLETAIRKLTAPNDKKKAEPVKSVLIDPDDIASRVQYEHEETLKRLNPDA